MSYLAGENANFLQILLCRAIGVIIFSCSLAVLIDTLILCFRAIMIKYCQIITRIILK